MTTALCPRTIAVKPFGKGTDQPRSGPAIRACPFLREQSRQVARS